MSNHPLRRLFRRMLGHRRTTVRPGASPGRRASDHEPMRGWAPAVAIALSVALVDWTTKYLIVRTVPLDDFRVVAGDRVAFWHVQNHAMALGLWENFPLPVRQGIALVAAVVGTLVLVQILGRGHRLPRGQRAWAWLFVGLVLGGMMGNLGERVLHWSVTDYLSLRWGDLWLPPGNVADVALFISMPLAVPVIVFELMGRARRGKGSPVAFAPETASGD